MCNCRRHKAREHWRILVNSQRGFSPARLAVDEVTNCNSDIFDTGEVLFVLVTEGSFRNGFEVVVRHVTNAVRSDAAASA